MAENPTMLTYIRETPATYAAQLEGRVELTGQLVELWASGRYRSVWLVACGSSANAAACARPFMRLCLQADVQLVNPTALTFSDYLPADDVLCLVISQSGCSTNALAALDHLRAQGRHAVGVTANADSDFREHADLLVDYGVGSELVGYVTKGMAGLVHFLMLFALEASRAVGSLSAAAYGRLVSDLSLAPFAHEAVQARAEAFYLAKRRALTSMGPTYVVGYDQAFGVAQEAALKLGETVKVPAFAYDADEFAHGPNLQLTPAYTLFFVDDLNHGSGRLKDIARACVPLAGPRGFLLTDDASLDGLTTLLLPSVREGRPAHPLMLPLYALPAFQYVAWRTTDELHRWETHPLVDEMDDALATKTEAISRIMPW